jgi:hypothetical protein
VNGARICVTPSSAGALLSHREESPPTGEGVEARCCIIYRETQAGSMGMDAERSDVHPVLRWECYSSISETHRLSKAKHVVNR